MTRSKSVSSPHDYAAHEETYNDFLSFLKWLGVSCVALVLFLGAVTSVVPWAPAFLFALVLFWGCSRL